MMEPTDRKPGRIFLIGFMCAGKSRVGRALATLLGIPFVDIDRVVEQRVGALAPFIQREGEKAFRKLESEVLDELLKGEAAVISTGGGTPCEGNNLERMQQAGTTVWLQVPMVDLMPRIERAGGDRPLLYGLKGAALQERVATLMEERLPIYSQADIIVPASAPIPQVAERIQLALDSFYSR